MKNLSIKSKKYLRHFERFYKEELCKLGFTYRMLFMGYMGFIKSIFKLILLFSVVYFAVGGAIAKTKGALVSNFIESSLTELEKSHFLIYFVKFVDLTFVFFIGVLLFLFIYKVIEYKQRQNKNIGDCVWII